MPEAGHRRDIILLVDDSPEALGFLTEALEQAGYSVLISTSGKGALGIVERITPDLILLDAVMPGYIAEGKPRLSIAIGCTGGQHRSVAIAEATGRYLERHQYHVSISHRDLAKANLRS